jgi:hypothetical protein
MEWISSLFLTGYGERCRTSFFNTIIKNVLISTNTGPTLDSRAFDINNKLKRREGSGSTGRFFD